MLLFRAPDGDTFCVSADGDVAAGGGGDVDAGGGAAGAASYTGAGAAAATGICCGNGTHERSPGRRFFEALASVGAPPPTPTLPAAVVASGGAAGCGGTANAVAGGAAGCTSMGGCAEWMTTVGWIIWNCGMGGMCGIGGGYGMPMWWGIGAMCCAGYGCGTCCAMGGIPGCTAAAWVGAGAAVAGACMGHGRCIAPAVDGWGGGKPPCPAIASAGIGWRHRRSSHAFLRRPGPPLLGRSKQLMHRSQSRRTQPAHSPQRLRGCRRVAVRETMPFVPGWAAAIGA